MSKQLSFRARALDTSKSMPVYKADEIPELPDFAAINRAVPQMPTGMEKEEETVISLFSKEVLSISLSAILDLYVRMLNRTFDIAANIRLREGKLDRL